MKRLLSFWFQLFIIFELVGMSLESSEVPAITPFPSQIPTSMPTAWYEKTPGPTNSTIPNDLRQPVESWVWGVVAAATVILVLVWTCFRLKSNSPICCYCDCCDGDKVGADGSTVDGDCGGDCCCCCCDGAFLI